MSRRERSLRWLGVMLSLTSWLAAGAMCGAQEQTPASGQRFRRENHTQPSSQPSPLERLRNRSAQERWQRHRDDHHWSPADPFQRDWPVDDAHQTAPLFEERPAIAPLTATAPATAEPTATTPPAVTAEAPHSSGLPAPAFPWAGNSGPEASATDTTNSADNPFTPLDNELWQNAPEAAAESEPTPATRSINVTPTAPQVATDVEDLLPTPAIPADPFADSRWVELGDGPEQQPAPLTLPISSSTTDVADTSEPFGIAPLAETQYGGVESADASDAANGLIAPGGVAAFATVDDGSEQAPAPMMQQDGPTNTEFLARIKPIREIVPFFQPEPMPVSNNMPTSPTDRGFTATEFAWAASNVYHNPLYFEDVSIERYGHTHHHLVQPFVSVGKFGAQFVALPYKMAIDPVWDEEYVLGHYRPGELAPFLFYQVPWNWRAAGTAAATYTGLIFLFP